jgi:hypothetical protein
MEIVGDVAHGESAYALSDPDTAVAILKESENPEAIIPRNPPQAKSHRWN